MRNWRRSEKIAIISLVISVLACIGGYIALPRISDALGLGVPPNNRCADYGIKIVTPQDGEEVDEIIRVSGTYKNKPPDGYFLTYVISPDNKEFWPQYKVLLNLSNQSWTGQCDLRGEPPKEAYCALAVVGKSGLTMFDYYRKIGNEQDVWVPFDKITEDTEICDRVFIQRMK